MKKRVDARYPADFGLLPGGKPPNEISQKMFPLAKNIFHAVKKELEIHEM